MFQILFDFINVVALLAAFVFLCDTARDCFEAMNTFDFQSSEYRTNRTLLVIFVTLSVIVGFMFLLSAISLVFN